MLSRLARYYVSLARLVLRRGIAARGARRRFMFAKPAMWPIGSRPSDDFLVDGKDILPEDLLLYYNSDSPKSRMKDAVKAARVHGYETVAWDRVRLPLDWLMRPSTISRYFLSPMWQTAYALFSGKTGYSCGLVSMMLDLRRGMVGWDIFFERHSVGAVFDSGVLEQQVAMTISAQQYGAASIKIQASEVLDRLNENHQYLSHHYHFTWGEGVKELWKSRWLTDHIVPVGYTWGSIHQAGLLKRGETRARYGVTGNRKLVVAFDTSSGRSNYISADAVRRFCGAISRAASENPDAVFVLKPKDPDALSADFASSEASRSAPNPVIVEDYMSANTNELIAAADLVISMAHSSTFIEALVCGVPAFAYDETGRDWTGVLPHDEQFVFDSADGLCVAARNYLESGIDAVVWEDVQARIAYNYGGADGLAIDRIRACIVGFARGAERLPAAVQKLEVTNTGV